ncbi:nesprin-1-like [Patiria miniata]|uniref:Calponin-homology (CH) domain-containing protein n=1 Tax=Patiria miniata TaxID=46514 RepID=A0A914BFY4_PATMI|nr:nesprin-1-like [Patiria miniata]
MESLRRGGRKQSDHVIQSQIKQLAEEQERVQTKTFTNWVNSHLRTSKREPPLQVVDLCQDVKNGVVLLRLLEVLSGETLPFERGRNMKRVHYLSNVNTCLRFLEGKKIKLVNINASDIIDGKPPIVLGLVWTIILYYQIEQNAGALEKLAESGMSSSTGSMESVGSTSDTSSTASKPEAPRPSSSSYLEPPPAKKAAKAVSKLKGKLTAKKALLAWAQKASKAAGSGMKLEIKDFGPSWRDGKAFNVLIHNIREGLIDLSMLPKRTNAENLDEAFNIAEQELGIVRLLDAQDVDVDKPDEKSIMTYVSQFFKAFPETGSKADKAKDEEAKICHDINEWLVKGEAMITSAKQKQRTKEEQYSQFVEFQAEHKKCQSLMTVVMDKKKKKLLLTLSDEQLDVTESRWSKLVGKETEWKRSVEAGLAGGLGPCGEWLNKAEALLDDDLTPLQSQEETHSSMRRKLIAHQEHFRDANRVHKTFLELSRTELAENVPPTIFQDMSERFNRVLAASQNRGTKLEYLEMKYRLLAFIVMAEKQLQAWTVKYGNKESVVTLLKNYKVFIIEDQFFEQYEETLQQMEVTTEAYHKTITNEKEREGMRRFLSDMKQKKRNLTVEITSIQSMLESVIEHWQCYTTNVGSFQPWLEEAEKVLQRGDQTTKMDYFSELSVWLDRHTAMNESGNFLIETCHEAASLSIQQQLLLINRRWKETFEPAKVYMKSNESEKLHQEFTSRVVSLNVWLDKAEKCVLQPVECHYSVIKEHVQQLDELRSQVPGHEFSFKHLSQLAQSLVKTRSKEETAVMVGTLRTVKDRLTGVRDAIPPRAKAVNEMSQALREYEEGMEDAEGWVEIAEGLLRSYEEERVKPTKMDPKEMENCLRRHKAHFSKAAHVGQQLEDKSQIVRYVISLNKESYTETTTLEKSTANIQLRYRTTVSLGLEWEERLSGQRQEWQAFEAREAELAEWLQQASKHLLEHKGPVSKQLDNHKAWFESGQPEALTRFLLTSQELLHSLSPEDRQRVESRVRALQDKYQALMRAAPLKFRQLQFPQAKEMLDKKLQEIETELAGEHQALKDGQIPADVMERHMNFFPKQQPLESCTQCIQSMEDIQKQLMTLDPKYDPSPLTQAIQQGQARHGKLSQEVVNLAKRLHDLPGLWQEYNDRFEALSQWVSDTNNIMKAIQTTDNHEDFRKLCLKFEFLSEMAEETHEELAWLNTTLKALSTDCPTQQKLSAERQLAGLLRSHKATLDSARQFPVEIVALTMMFTYVERTEKLIGWLREVREQMKEPVDWTSLESLQKQMEQHMAKNVEVQQREPDIKELTHSGRDLQQQQQQQTPMADRVGHEATELDRLWKDVKTKTAHRAEQLKECLKQRQIYEDDKKKLESFLRKADTEVHEPAPLAGLGPVQEKLNAVKALQDEQTRLKPLLMSLRNQNLQMEKTATDEAIKQALQDNLRGMESRTATLREEVAKTLETLRGLEERWKELEADQARMVGWLEATASKLDEIETATEVPEETLRQAEVLFAEIFGKQSDLSLQEKTLEALTKDLPILETQALMAQHLSLHNQWETLCSRAKLQSAKLSEGASQWQLYQQRLQQLKPWLDKTEEQLEGKATGKECGSLQDVERLIADQKVISKELEEHQPILSSIQELSSQLVPRQSVQSEVGDLSDRFRHIEQKTDDLRRELTETEVLWKEYEEVKGRLGQALETLEEGQATHCKEYTGNTGKLEKQLDDLKELLSDQQSAQPDIDRFHALNQALRQHPRTNPHGLAKLQDNLHTTDTRLSSVSSALQEGVETVETTLEERQEFVQEVERLTADLQEDERCFSEWIEVYDDKVEEEIKKAQANLARISGQGDRVGNLTGMVQAICSKCDATQELAISRKVTGVSMLQDGVQETAALRITVLNFFLEFCETRQVIVDTLKEVEEELSQESVTEGKVEKLLERLEAVKPILAEWRDRSQELDNRAQRAKVIPKMRGIVKGEPSSPVETEMTRLRSKHDELTTQLSSLRDELSERARLMGEFWEKQRGLSEWLDSVDADLDEKKASRQILSEENLRDFLKDYQACQSQLNKNQPSIADLNILGKHIQESNPAQRDAIQAALDAVNDHSSEIQERVDGTAKKLETALSLWQELDRCKRPILESIVKVSMVTEQPIKCSSREEAEELLQQHQIASEELSPLQDQAQHLQSITKDLTSLLNTLPTSSTSDLPPSVQDATTTIPSSLATSAAVVQERMANLRRQLELWEAVRLQEDALASWLGAEVSELEQVPARMEDEGRTKARLDQFKTDVSSREAELTLLATTVQELRSMNPGAAIPVAEEAVQRVEANITQAKQLALNAESSLGEFTSQRDNLRARLQDLMSRLLELDDRLTRCSDLGLQEDGITEEIIECQAVASDLSNLRPALDTLVNDLQTLLQKFPKSNASQLQADLDGLGKKFTDIELRDHQIHKSLTDALLCRCQDLLKEVEAEMEYDVDELSNSASTQGEPQTLERRLNDVKDLKSNSLPQHSSQLAVINAKLEKVLPLLSDSQRALITQEAQGRQNQLTKLHQDADEAEKALESCLLDWRDFEETAQEMATELGEVDRLVEAELVPCSSVEERRAQLKNLQALAERLDFERPTLTTVDHKADRVLTRCGTKKPVDQAAELQHDYDQIQARVKEAMAQCEQGILQHEGFLKTTNEAQTFLQQAEDTLVTCADPSGDRNMCEDKLQTSESLLTKQDQIQSHLDSAIQAQDQLAPQTTPDGQSSMISRIQLLQGQWNQVVAGLNQCKALLEERMRRWKEYKEDLEDLDQRLQKWDESVGRASELREDLPEKASHLEEVKLLQAEIRNQSERIQNFQEKADSLAANNLVDVTQQVESQAENVQQQYQDLLDRINDIQHQQEESVVAHESWQEAADDMSGIITAVEEGLNQTASLPTQVEELHAKKAQVMELQAKLPKGQSKLTQLGDCTSKALASTAAAGQPKLSHHAAELSEKWNALQAQAAEAESRIAEMLRQRGHHDDKREDFAKWLSKTEKELAEASQLCPDLEGKEKISQKCEELTDDIANHEPALADILHSAHQFNDNLSEQLAARYHALKDGAADAKQQAVKAVDDHRFYNQSVEDCKALHAQTEKTLEENAGIPETKEELQKQLDNLQMLQQSRPDGEQKVEQSVAIATNTLPLTSPEGQEVIQQSVATLQQESAALQDHADRAKDQSEQALQKWEEHDDRCMKLSDWMAEAGAILDDLGKPCSDMVERKRKWDILQSLSQEVETHKGDVEILSPLTQELHDVGVRSPTIQTNTETVNTEYQELCDKLKDSQAQCSQGIRLNKEFLQAVERAETFLQQAEETLAACCDPSGDRKMCQDKLQTAENLLDKQDLIQTQLDAATETLNSLDPHTAPEANSTHQATVQSLKSRWDQLVPGINQCRALQGDRLDQWVNFEVGVDEMGQWCLDMETALTDAAEPREDLADKRTHLEEVKVLKENIESQAKKLEELQQKSCMLTSANTPEIIESVERQVAEAEKRYQDLLDRMKGIERQQEESVVAHESWQEAADDMSGIITAVEEGLNQTFVTPSDVEELQAKMQCLKELQARFPEGRSKLNQLQDFTQQALASTADAGQPKFNQQATQLNDRWEKVLAKVAESEAKLATNLQQRGEHDGKRSDFEKWLAEKEVELEECSMLQTDLPGKEDASHRCKSLVEEVAQHEPQLTELMQSAQQLLDTSIESVSVRFHTLKHRASESSERADRALDDHRLYNQSVDQLQSWLAEAERILDDNKEVPPRLDKLKQQLQNLKNLEQTQETGHHKLEDTSARADLVLALTAPPGQNIVHRSLSGQQQDVTSLTDHTTEAKDQLQQVLEKWEGHNAGCRKLSDWLMAAETALVNLEKPCVYLEEKKMQLDKLMSLEEDVVSQQPDIEVLTPQAQELTEIGVSDPSVSAKAQDIGDEYRDLCSRLKVARQEREEQVTDHEQLTNQLQELNDCLKAKQLELDQCSGLAADREANEERIQQLQVVLASLSDGESQLQSTLDQSGLVCPNTAPAGRDRINQQLQTAADKLKSLIQQAERANRRLDDSVQLQRSYEERSHELKGWMGETEAALEEEVDAGEGQLEAKQAHLDKIKALCDESQELQPIRAQVTSLGQQLIASNPAAVHVGSETTRLTAGYQTLHMNLKIF